MSTLDRAFFRAYAKEQPSVQPLPAEERLPADARASESPYVHFITSRQSELRYRIDRTHAPRNQTATSVADTDLPKIDSPVSAPKEDDYRLAASFEVPSDASVWPRAVPASSNEATTTIAPADPFAQGIVCLPGLDVPESNYLASFLAAKLLIEEAAEPIVELAAVERIEEIDRRAEAAHEIGRPTVEESGAVGRPATTTVEEQATTTDEDAAAPMVEGIAAVEEPAIATAAFWEVDRYLYPEITDRLLGEYDYFSQAGEKLKIAANAGLKVLGVTGVGRDEGRSTLVLCLARAAAQAGLKVAIIDSDFERPQLAQQMGLDISAGWESVAQGKLPFAEVAIRSLADGITLLPLTEAATGCSLSLSDAAVHDVLQQAKASHDVVILDLGPLDASAKLDWPASPLDAALVVWDRRHRKVTEAQAVARILNAAGVEAVGIAENFAEIVL